MQATFSDLAQGRHLRLPLAEVLVVALDREPGVAEDHLACPGIAVATSRPDSSLPGEAFSSYDRSAIAQRRVAVLERRGVRIVRMRPDADAAHAIGRGEVPVELRLGSIRLDVAEDDQGVGEAVFLARPASSQTVSSTGSGPA